MFSNSSAKPSRNNSHEYFASLPKTSTLSPDIPNFPASEKWKGRLEASQPRVSGGTDPRTLKILKGIAKIVENRMSEECSHKF